MTPHRPLQDFFLALVSAACLFVATFPLSAEQRTPLLMEGKKNLYQRIVSHPSARRAY